MADIVWRPYQVKCKEEIKKHYDQGIKKQLIVQATGCHAINTLILMYDGSLKYIQDIVVGELLMGDDSTPRKVLELYTGQEVMYEIKPIKGKSFVVNGSHILSLKKTPTPGKYPGLNEIVNITVKNYLTTNRHFKHLYKLYRTGVSFNNTYRLPDLIDPYWIGLWLGDGSYNYPQITNEDTEIISYLSDLRLKDDYKMHQYHKGNGLYSMTISLGNEKTDLFHTNEYNQFLNDFRGIDGEKEIPVKYCTLPYRDRLQLLAGLIDSDGSLSCNGYDFINKSYALSESVTFIARSLGLAAYMTECTKGILALNYSGIYYRVSITGNTNIIPCKIERKRAKKRKQKKDVLVTGFSVKELRVGQYFGFELDQNHLYCMGDFTVTHNTGKRLAAVNLMHHFKRSLFIAHREELIMQAYDEINKFYPMNVGIIKGKVFEADKKIVVASVQTLYNRLDRIDSNAFDLVIIDEVHHYCAKSYLITARHWQPKLLTGWTATPKRLDGLSLTNLFEKLVFEYNIHDGIKDGYLAPIEAYQIKSQSDISKVKRTAGDFNQKELSEAVDCELRNNLIVQKYKQYTPGRPAIAYCVDIEHAYHLRDEFRKNKISCEAVSSDESRGDDRTEIVKKFRNKEFTVLTNCEILTEGFDFNDVGAVLMARPTQSETLYVQCIGRATRLKSEAFVTEFKTDKATILDFVDNTGKLNLINAYELEKGIPIEDRMFLPAEHKEKLLLEEKKRRERRIKLESGHDRKIDLLHLPEVKVFDSEKMLEPATEKQLDWIKKAGVYVDGVEYTKLQASELISNLPCSSWQIEFLAINGYDVSKGAVMGQYQRVKYAIEQRQKYSIDSKIKSKITEKWGTTSR